jgi:hypothetical protein
MVAAECVEMTLPAVVKTRPFLWHEDNPKFCSLAEVCDV